MFFFPYNISKIDFILNFRIAIFCVSLTNLSGSVFILKRLENILGEIDLFNNSNITNTIVLWVFNWISFRLYLFWLNRFWNFENVFFRFHILSNIFAFYFWSCTILLNIKGWITILARSIHNFSFSFNLLSYFFFLNFMINFI